MAVLFFAALTLHVIIFSEKYREVTWVADANWSLVLGVLIPAFVAGWAVEILILNHRLRPEASKRVRFLASCVGVNLGVAAMVAIPVYVLLQSPILNSLPMYAVSAITLGVEFAGVVLTVPGMLQRRAGRAGILPSRGWRHMAVTAMLTNLASMAAGSAAAAVVLTTVF
jgi:hypothetical protein